MSSYEKAKEFETRLRAVVLHSADVMRNEVSTYLQDIAEHGDWRAQQDILKEYVPLVDQIPADFVDFCLRVLVRKEDDERRFDFHDWRELGVRHDSEFFPAAHIQGPFLYTLRSNETEGLRLVHQLTNVAVARWCEREKSPAFLDYIRTPLPATVNIDGNLRKFWGSQDVYYWFRPSSMGPNAVTSALMAFEVWMEHEIEDGRDPEELFNRVMFDSNCVAVLGACLSVALAFPDKCLRAALPIVSAPAVWLMDIARAAADQSPSLNLNFLGRHETIYESRAERDKCPQRARDIRDLAMMYELSAPQDLRDPFENALSRFTSELPFSYQEEKDNEEFAKSLLERMENFQIYADRNNYRQRRTDKGFEIWVEPPEQVKARNETALSSLSSQHRWMSVSIWAQASMRDRKPAPGMTLAEVVSAAREAQRPSDFATSEGAGSDPDDWRVQAMAGVAAAAIVLDYDEEDVLVWCRDTLLLAAQMPEGEDPLYNRDRVFPLDPKVSAARGLAALAAREAADDAVREQLLRVVASPQLQVVQAVFEGLRDAWSIETVLCWNALALGLSLSMVPGTFLNSWRDSAVRQAEEQWKKQLLDLHLKKLKRKARSQLPRLQLEEHRFLWDLAARCMHALPLEDLCRDDACRKRILRLTDDLMAWTLEENRPSERARSQNHMPPWEWNHFIMEWVALLGRHVSLEEVRKHVFEPVCDAWPSAPHLTVELLNGYISHQIGDMEEPSPDSQAQWRELCDRVLDSDEVVNGVHRRHLGQDVAEALRLIVYVRHGASLLKDDWPHGRLFEDVTAKWVTTAGHHPEAYRSLIIMLDGPGFVFAPEPALSWLKSVVNRANDVEAIWDDNGAGDRTARLLMRIWNSYEASIRDDANTLKDYSRLVDQLSAAGVALASLLQSMLDRK